MIPCQVAKVSSTRFTKTFQRSTENLPNPLKLPNFLYLAHFANVASAASQILYQEAESVLPVEKILRRHWLSTG